MPALSPQSREKLNTCHADLQTLVLEVAKKFNVTVLCGHRDKAEQDKAFAEGSSKVTWPNSKHNRMPSEAVDLAVYPIDWKDVRRFYYLSGYVRATAERLNIKIRIGADWNGDFEIKDENFLDLPHVELTT